MMKKTTSALAIAALLGTGAATAATFQIDDNTTFSVAGDVELKYVSDTVDEGGIADSDTDNSWDGGPALSGGGSEIKFSGEHTADNGLTTFFTLDVDGFDVTGNDQRIKQDESTFFGVRGDFGTVTFGDINVSNDAIRDLADPMDSLTLDTVAAPGEVNETLQYASPSFGMVSFVVDVSGGVADDDDAQYTGRVDVALDAATLHAGYADFKDGDDYDSNWNLGASMSVQGLTLAANYGRFDASADSGEDDVDILNASVTAPIGDANVYAVLGYADFDEGDFTQFGAGMNYAITGNLSMFAEAASFDDITQDSAGGDAKPEQFAIGTILKF